MAAVESGSVKNEIRVCCIFTKYVCVVYLRNTCVLYDYAVY